MKLPQDKISITHLKQYLKSCSQEELALEITELFKKFPSVQDYYQIKLYPHEQEEIADKYKKIIKDEFFPVRGLGKLRLTVAKKAITDYKKICKTDAALIDIMLFYVEQGVKFANTYGDIEESFYLSMERVYQQAIDLIVKSNLRDTFKQHCQTIMRDTSETGWGFYDSLAEIYERAFCSTI